MEGERSRSRWDKVSKNHLPRIMAGIVSARVGASQKVKSLRKEGDDSGVSEQLQHGAVGGRGGRYEISNKTSGRQRGRTAESTDWRQLT